MELFGFNLHDTYGYLLVLLISIDVSLAVRSEYHVRLEAKNVLVVSVDHPGNESEKDETIFRTQVDTPINQEVD